jgi:hypothetical protein
VSQLFPLLNCGKRAIFAAKFEEKQRSISPYDFDRLHAGWKYALTFATKLIAFTETRSELSSSVLN